MTTKNSIIKFHLYIAGFFFNLYRLNPSELIEKGDAVSYHDVYRGVNFHNLADWFSAELFLPLIYLIFKTLFGDLNIESFIKFQQLLVYAFIGYALIKSTKGWLPFLFLILFLDSSLLAHLSRQFLSAAFVILALVELCSKKRFSVVGLLVILSGFSHLTGPIFFALAFLFTKCSENHLRFTLILCSFFGIISIAMQFIHLLAFLHGVPVLGKAFFALVVFISSGESNVRLFAIIGAGIMVLFPAKTWQEKITVGFLALSMALYNVPILNSRIGLIGTSIYVGLPYWLLLQFVLILFTPKSRLDQSNIARPVGALVRPEQS
jgi:hypothetical protein